MPRQTSPPRNHPSATERLNVLRKNIRKEQDLGRCIVVDRAVAQFWPGLFLSPFGEVDKGNGEPDVAGRVIHDLSFPEGASVNDHTDVESVPTAEYKHCTAIAREILAQKERFPGRSINILLGDVATAFRNLGTWTGSPGFCGVIGDAIAHIHGTTSNAYYPDGFFNYHWVDDHVCIAADVGKQDDGDAVKWWADMDHRTPERKRTWTNLKKALLRRYGEKLDKSAAEWRVSMRRMMPGETHAYFTASLRDVVGRNKVSERVLLAQFYRCLDKPTKKLVKQRPKPRTLDEAVDKATDEARRASGSSDLVQPGCTLIILIQGAECISRLFPPLGFWIQLESGCQRGARAEIWSRIVSRSSTIQWITPRKGMINIGQAWATTLSRYVTPMSGAMGDTNMIPGISGTGLPTEMVGSGSDAMLRSEVE
ncbi:hypothetical protein PHYSODRAFT_329162 [Phytophthora sojae]|uniref:Retrotransposon gag domain-containing protein n=1 Tax=Phytophthora sojae (strain P6497) TaxID=1094619 RepID=G4Z981_PHYSP|nr:hypothetical protein PHYSODRAFT_329162 [Phytophthora sojae]EGZ21135.1 hypothetical protein PHYSODRAFT_329162 [Phytophthora sojae]|eukprot:XP_009523852.1 hypothetical protein PHYSODRAFT_329162 [Phytophthora sojae]